MTRVSVFGDAFGKLTIGNNVFIGMNEIVLRDVTIGNDVIIGAGSVVAEDCESGWNYAGNPAKKIYQYKIIYRKGKMLNLKKQKSYIFLIRRDM